MRKFKKKGQITLQDAPAMVMIVGFVFLMMATVALVSEKYGASAGATREDSKVNETLTTVTEQGEHVAQLAACNFGSMSVSAVHNVTAGQVIAAGNYTASADGYIRFTGADVQYNNTDWYISYSYKFGGSACNVTRDLNREIGDNTSIAGIILTISLVGIVLSILIGVFVLARERRV